MQEIIPLCRNIGKKGDEKMTFKNVYFHKFNVYRRSMQKGKKEADTMVKSYLKNKDIDKWVNEILTNNLKNDCTVLDNSTTQETLEVLDYDEKYIYARIGKMKDIFTVHLRNKQTLKASPIARTTGQELEIFTYLLIDRKNYIVSYIKEQSAPSIQKLGYLIDNNYAQSHKLYGEIASVLIEDAIPILKSKKTIGSISYKVSIPTDEKINIDRLGLTEKQFESLRNQKSIEIDVQLTAQKNKDSIPKREKLDGFIKGILKLTKKVNVKAKNENEYMQNYKIVDSLFTKRVKFEFDRDAKSIRKEIKDKLVQVYEANQEDILEFVKRE